MAGMQSRGYYVLDAQGGMLMNVEWNVRTYNQQEALRHFSSGQRHQVRRETEEQLRNLGLAEHDGVGAKISKIGLHLLQSH
ncbi:MAG TPA: hypothetical protein VIL30_25950 [Ramlibacter sp.]